MTSEEKGVGGEVAAGEEKCKEKENDGKREMERMGKQDKEGERERERAIEGETGTVR